MSSPFLKKVSPLCVHLGNALGQLCSSLASPMLMYSIGLILHLIYFKGKKHISKTVWQSNILITSKSGIEMVPYIATLAQINVIIKKCSNPVAKCMFLNS